ncbi:hypothetical protein NLG97_g4387 [Lecanicillium saksenae]|uniref:Uncharacterized protein n=1 Tax=Lecanicillium saksenae TaxID=468837 RepID=A0ACC1QVL8_9HYPO|nr:hypothetical protein NLG97_g4387 [Lecanicillium saksenae]
MPDSPVAQTFVQKRGAGGLIQRHSHDDGSQPLRPPTRPIYPPSCTLPPRREELTIAFKVQYRKYSPLIRNDCLIRHQRRRRNDSPGARHAQQPASPPSSYGYVTSVQRRRFEGRRRMGREKWNYQADSCNTDPQQPHAETENADPELGLRGGHQGETCPGRFCFIIPCPIPINCCIFPCPC